MSASSRLSRIARLPLGSLALALLVLAFSGVVAVAPADAVSFATHADYATGASALSCAVGDFNGDGKLDLVTANYYGFNVSVLLGDGSGGFAAKSDFAAGAYSRSIAVGDFNGDGKQDVVTNLVTVLLGNGSGGFGAYAEYPTGSGAQSVAVGDFNGDGKQDLATADDGANTVSVLLGDGSGGFASRSPFATGNYAKSVAVGDFNGDGKQDLVTTNVLAGTVSVLLGDGSGGFAAKTDFATGSEPWSVAVADFNGDGKQDLVTVDYGDGKASVLLGDGSGGFALRTSFTTGSGPESVAVGDFNGDGRQDLATANYGDGTASVLLGAGNGTFAAKADFATSAHAWAVAAGDFDADGKLDLAVVNGDASTISVLLNTGSPPAGSVSLDVGATWSNSRSVTIDSAVSGATQMRFRDQGGVWSAWEAYAATRSWILPGGDGSKTVQAQYCNADATLTCSDSIGLDTTPPDITVPVAELNMTLEAVSPAGNVVNFHVTISDAVDPAPALTITPASGSTFPLGATTVTLTGTDAAGNTATKTLKVTIKDTIAPHLTPPDNITAEATSAAGAVVDFTATATDTGDAHPAVTSVPASGSVFPLGTTVVTVTATDASGNIATGTFNVWVRDTTWPTLAKPDDITAEATGPGGAHVSWADIVATDAVDGNITAVCTPASGSLFALGETTVNVVAMDAHGNSNATTFKVKVEAASAATLTVPGDYATIQAAVDAAAPGDTIAVSAGVYYEHVTIAKPLTLTGAGAGATTIDGSGSGPVLTVSGAGVTVRQLTVTDGGSSTHPASNGIRVSGATGASFDGVEVSFCEAAYMLVSSSGTSVRNGVMHDNHAFGFDNGDTGSANTLLEDCDVYGNLGTQGGGAINAYAGSSGFTVRRTHVHDNANAAVQIGWSSGWLIEDSTLEGNAHGLVLDSASGGTCRGNELSGNTGNGVTVAGWYAQGNLFASNSIAGNAQGCRLSGPYASGNVFRENTLSGNAVGVAITLNASGDNSGNRFYRNNFAANTLQALDESIGGNYWDNGLPDGGNWWSDWTAPDADHDGFVDAPYVFTGGQDGYPFVLEVVPRAFEVHRSVESTDTYTNLFFKGWSAGATLALTVDDPSTVESPDYETSFVAEGPMEGSDGFAIGIDYEVMPGDVVTVSDGSVTKSHTVTDIAVTEIDTAADVVHGTAVPGSELTVYADDANRWTSAAGDGTWAVDFSVPDGSEQTVADIVPGTRGGAEQFDADGDSTVYDWEVPRGPFFSVSPIEPAEHMWGEAWQPNSEVTIEIDDPGTTEPVDFSMTAITDENGRFELFGIPFDIRAGDLVTVSQGATVKTHVVIDLRVTLIDPVADTVSGIGKPDTETVVNMWDDPGEGSQRIVTSDGSGAWTADFSVPGADGSPAFDIRPGMMTYTYQGDEDGDQTQIDYRLFSISVTAPTGASGKTQGEALPVTWTTNAAVTSGQFSLWVVSPGNGWYVGKIHDAADTVGPASYADSVDLNVPADTGYRVFVYYRASSGDPWTIYGMSSGTVDVAGGFTSISVTAPTGTTGKSQGEALPVTWTTNAAVTSGQFSLWVVSPANGWYVGKIVAADGTDSYVERRRPERARRRRLPRVRLLPRHLHRPLGHLRAEPGHGERDRGRLQRHQRDRAHRRLGQDPGRGPAGHLDHQRGRDQRPVQPLGGQPRERLVRGQDRRRRRRRQLRERRRPERARRRRLPRLRLLPGDERRPLEPLRAEPGHGERDRARLQRHQRDRPDRHRQPGAGHRPAGHLDDQRGRDQRPVQPLGGLALERLVRGQGRRRRRH